MRNIQELFYLSLLQYVMNKGIEVKEEGQRRRLYSSEYNKKTSYSDLL